LNYNEQEWIYFQHRALLQTFAVDYAKQNGLWIVAKECQRTPLQAWANSLVAKTFIIAIAPDGTKEKFPDAVGGVGKSQSQHLKSLADDWYIWKDGADVTEIMSKPLGDYWKSLDPLNRFGGDFVHPRPDWYHYERNI